MPGPGRPDLLALTADGLAQLGNVGLVRRAQRELDAGAGPVLDDEDATGAIVARFPEGTVTRLAAGKPPDAAACTCPASGMCRHRVALVLAYQRRAAAAAGSAPGPVEAQPWDPGTLDAGAFEAALPAGAKAELQRLLAARPTVRVERGPVPAARLPMATVRFLAPNSLALARCDCVAGTNCAHVALALRAFRAAEPGTDEVTLGGPATPVAVDDLSGAVDAVLRRLLEVGVVAGPSAHAPGIERARRAAAALGSVQVLLALAELGEQVGAYEARSARYDERTALALAAELFARCRVAGGVALGTGEPMETAMGKTRLVSLGGRVVAEDGGVKVRVAFADTDTGAAMLAERWFAPPAPGRLFRVEAVAGRMLAPGIPVAGAAHGQVLSSVVRRRADGLLAFGAGGQGRTTVMPRPAVGAFGPPLRASGLDTVLAAFASRPVSLLRPRNRVGDLHVFAVDAVLGQAWEPGAQVWQAAVQLSAGGGVLVLRRTYDAGAPDAIDVLAAAAAERFGPVQQVSGTVRAEGDQVVCDPWSLGANRFVVPDLDRAEAGTTLPASDGDGASPTLPEQAHRFLAGAVHAGRAGDRDRPTRGAELVAGLRTAGFAATAERLVDWLRADDEAAVRAFGRAAVWLATLLEARGASNQV